VQDSVTITYVQAFSEYPPNLSLQNTAKHDHKTHTMHCFYFSAGVSPNMVSITHQPDDRFSA